MNASLIFFIFLFVFLAISQLVLLIYLATKKMRAGRKEQLEHHIYEEAMPAFIQYLYTEKDDYIPLPPDEYHVAEKLFSDSMAIVKDEALHFKISESASYYLSSYYERVMKTGDWSARVNALYYIEDFHMMSLQPLLAKRLTEIKTQDEEKQQLLRTLATIGDLSILQYLENDPATTESVYLAVFTRFPEEVIPEAVTFITEQGSLMATLSFVKYVGFAKKIAYLPYIEKKLEDDNPEMRIQALKAIFRMNYMSDTDNLAPFFKSDIWEERMFVAKIAGTLSLSQFEKELCTLLGDTNWWVRYYAAEALLLAFGENHLLELSQIHPDQYARDMAAQWLKLERQVTIDG